MFKENPCVDTDLSTPLKSHLRERDFRTMVSSRLLQRLGSATKQKTFISKDIDCLKEKWAKGIEVKVDYREK